MTKKPGKSSLPLFTSRTCTEANILNTLQSPEKQHGATLIVALVFLLILTAAGITAVRLATVEERMASNSQFRGATFQLAQSEIKAQLLFFNQNIANRASLQTALTNAAAPITRFPNRLADQALTAQISTTGLTQSSKINFMAKPDCATLGLGDSFESFSCRQYEMTMRSTLSGGAYSEQVQGIYFITPN